MKGLRVAGLTGYGLWQLKAMGVCQACLRQMQQGKQVEYAYRRRLDGSIV